MSRSYEVRYLLLGLVVRRQLLRLLHGLLCWIRAAGRERPRVPQQQVVEAAVEAAAAAGMLRLAVEVQSWLLLRLLHK
jgi:hypothetical protein